MIERMIVESLSKQPRTLGELLQDTGLRKKILLNSLSSLIASRVVIKGSHQFTLNQLLVEETLGHNRDEIKELMAGVVDQYFDCQESSISLEKVWMSEEDEKTMTELLLQIEHFLSTIKTCSARGGKERPLWEQKVFYWGMASYKNALAGQLRWV